jgi:hypothetical protein
VEDHVDRKVQMGTRVLINDGWNKALDMQVLTDIYMASPARG